MRRPGGSPWEGSGEARDAWVRVASKVVSSQVAGSLSHFPGVSRPEQLPEVAGAALGGDLLDLRVHPVLVDGVVHGAEHAQGSGEARSAVHAREQEGIGGVAVLLVVHDEVAL